MSENDHKKRTDAYNTLYFLWIGLILIESSIINYQSNSSYVAKMWFVDWNLQFEIFCCWDKIILSVNENILHVACAVTNHS